MKFKPCIVGHRGYPKCYPENSLRGALAAIEAGAHAVEIDVHLTKDGLPIVLHDVTLARTSESKITRAVQALNFTEIEGVSVHEPKRFGDRFEPTPLCTLKAFCEGYAHTKSPLFIELKVDSLSAFSAEEYLRQVLEASLAIATHQLFIISYSRDIVRLAKERFAVQVGWVLESLDQDILNIAQQFKPDIVICDIGDILDLNVLEQAPWHWFIYDIVDPDIAKALAARGTKYIETWDVEALTTAFD